MAALEAENLRANERALAAEQHVARLAQLVASVTQLHQTDAVDEVRVIVKEVVANLLGCEEMGIFEVTTPGPIYTYADGIGIDADRFTTLPAGAPILREASERGGVVLPDDPAAAAFHGRPVSAVIPLVDAGSVRSVVVLFQLLRQKQGWEPGDRDLMETLALHGGRALANARLRERGA
ncbi:MAG: hypothetical protein ACM3UX_00775 [Candidatus Woesearchaeota archaeon]